MFKLNLKIALRNLWKHKGYTFINIAGLSVGLAACILIFVFIRYHLSFDDQYDKKDRIFRVTTEFFYSDGVDHSPGVSIPFTPALRSEFSQFEKVAAIDKEAGVISAGDRQTKEVKIATNLYYAEPAFFEIFNFNWLEGNPANALKAPNQVAISEEMAKKFFGSTQNAMGQVLKFQNKVIFKVAGVFKDQTSNSSFPLKIVASYLTFSRRDSKEWKSTSSESNCYVLLKEGLNITQLQQPLKQFIQKYEPPTASTKIGHLFQPLKDLHTGEEYNNYAEQFMPSTQIWGLAIIGLFLLITACINFVNLATAQVIGRSKEVGVRKVMGSNRIQLVLQFICETTTITIIALLVACILAELALPGMQNLFKEKVNFSLFGQPIIFLFMFVLIAFVSLLAGFYPALVMSGFDPVLAIKNKMNTGSSGGGGLRRILIVVQFGITIILIVGTMVVLRQMKYMREKPLGFNSNSIAVIGLTNDSTTVDRFNTLKDRLLRIPGVQNASLCFAPPSSLSNNTVGFHYAGVTEKKPSFVLSAKAADVDYFKTFDLRFAAGRPFGKSDTIKEYVVNETLVKKLQLVDANAALGKKIKLMGHEGFIVGVVKDFNNSTLRDAIVPIAIFSARSDYAKVALKIDNKSLLQTMKLVEREWNSIMPEDVFSAKFMDDQINEYYESEQVTGTLFKVFAGVVIFISLIGLFGLISFVAVQRTRELAIRKVLGASTIELVNMLNRSFLIMVFMANVVAWPLAYWLVSKWLSNFAYRISLSIWPFVIAMLVSMVVTLVTVSLRSFAAAQTKPIDALKYE